MDCTRPNPYYLHRQLWLSWCSPPWRNNLDYPISTPSPTYLLHKWIEASICSMKGKGKICVPALFPLYPPSEEKVGALGCETLLHQKRVLSVAFVEYGVIAWRPLIMVDWEMRCIIILICTCVTVSWWKKTSISAQFQLIILKVNWRVSNWHLQDYFRYFLELNLKKHWNQLIPINKVLYFKIFTVECKFASMRFSNPCALYCVIIALSLKEF